MLNSTNRYSQVLNVSAGESGGSFSGALRPDLQKLVLCSYATYSVYALDLNASTATLEITKTIASNVTYPDLEIISAAIVPGAVFLGIYYDDS